MKIKIKIQIAYRTVDLFFSFKAVVLSPARFSAGIFFFFFFFFCFSSLHFPFSADVAYRPLAHPGRGMGVCVSYCQLRGYFRGMLWADRVWRRGSVDPLRQAYCTYLPRYLTMS
jgi:hypothetical protein